MKSKLNLLYLLGIALAGIVIACKDEFTDIIDKPILEEKVTKAIQDSLNKIQKIYVDGLPHFPQPTPNQQLKLSEKTQTIGDSMSCTDRVLKTTSSEHEKLMLPDPISPFEIGRCYLINTIPTGAFTPILEGLGGTRRLTITSGPWSDSTTVEPDNVAIGISNLQKKVPSPHRQDVDIFVEEAQSSQQVSVKFGATFNSTFFDFASKFGYSSSEYAYKYFALVKVTDFSVRVKDPTRIYDWYPTMKDPSVYGRWSPVYASRMEYGKLLVMSIETNYQKSKVDYTVNAAFGGFFTGGTFDSDGSFAQMSKNSKIKVMTIGGDLKSVIGLLDGSKPSILNYLKSLEADKYAATSAPLFAEFRFLKDNSVAKVILATDEYPVRDCRVFEKGSHTIRKPSNYYSMLLPVHSSGDKTMGHSPYKLDVEAELFTKSGRDVWCKYNLYLRELWGKDRFGDTEAKLTKEVLLDNSAVPSGEKITGFVNAREEYALIMPGIAHDSPYFVGVHIGHGEIFSFNAGTNTVLLANAPKRFKGIIREINAVSGHDGPDFPGDGTRNRNFVRIFYNEIGVKTRKTN